MDKTTTVRRPITRKTQYEAEVDGCIARIRDLQDQMTEDQAEIEIAAG